MAALGHRDRPLRAQSGRLDAGTAHASEAGLRCTKSVARRLQTENGCKTYRCVRNYLPPHIQDRALWAIAISQQLESIEEMRRTGVKPAHDKSGVAK